MTLRAIIWTAVSTRAQADEDEHYSLKAQEDDARALCEREDWQIVDVLRVPGHSRDYKTLERLAADARAQGIDAFDKLTAHFEACDFDVFICRDANRFGRSPSLIHQIVEYIIDDCSARIYSFNDGWIDSSNADIFAMIKAYTTKKEMRWIRDMGVRGKDKLAERGLIPHIMPMTHIAVRDERTGRQARVEVNEAKRRLWDDIADLLLAGVGWNILPRELEARGHVDDGTGKRYSYGKLYRLMYSPLTWGHTARRWGYEKTRKAGGGVWAFDESEPLPANVLLFRHRIPAVWTGETAERLKAELRRRVEMVGSRRPQNTHRFSGLVLCAECRRAMVVHSTGRGRYGLYCNTHLRRSYLPRDCTNTRIVNFEYLQDFFNTRLSRALDASLPDMLAQYSPAEPGRYAEQLAAAEADRAALVKQVERLIGEQAAAPDELQPIYRDQLKAHADRLNALTNEVHRLQAHAEEASTTTAAQTRELSAIRDMTLDAFWKLPDREINQRLRAMMGSWRFLARGGEIVDAARIR
jgi:DNA invertase Pin-like site-specific DNA recombinase